MDSIIFGVAAIPVTLWAAWEALRLIKRYGIWLVLVWIATLPAYLFSIRAIFREMSKYMKDFSYDILSGFATYEWISMAILILYLVIISIITRRNNENREDVEE